MRSLWLAVCFCIAADRVLAIPLRDQLNALEFRNEGVTNSSETFIWKPIVPTAGSLLYLEAYNVTSIAGGGCAGGGWSQNNPFPYLHGTNSSRPPPCSFTATSTMDRPGNDYRQIQFAPGTKIDACAAACCADGDVCKAYVFVHDAPLQLEACVKGSACCWLKNVVPAECPCPAVVTTGCLSAVSTTPSQPTYVPASGMRSAVPLGGVSAGSFELRGDGTLHEWTIMNQSPGGAAKIQEYENAFFAVRAGGVARVLQTHPRGGLPGVAALRYQGSHPVSRLDVLDNALPVNLSLYAFSTYKVNDLAASSRPMAAFALTVENPTNVARDVSFMFNVPLNVEVDQLRSGPTLSSSTTANATACYQTCIAAARCAEWVFADGQCTLHSAAASNRYAQGQTSGVRGTWSADTANRCLTLSRPGSGPMHGNASLCAAAEPLVLYSSFGTDDSAASLFGKFAAGDLRGTLNGAYGAVSVTASVPAFGHAVLVLTFGWYFPERDHFGVIYGNQYATLFRDSQDAAFGRVSPDARLASLSTVLTDIAAMHQPFFSSSLPPWLQDQLVNSLSHIRSGMWFRSCPHCIATRDARANKGFWRQWEAYDCSDLDSIHNDGERHMPYILFFPESERNKMAAWAHNQRADGMLAEQIHNADPDAPEGRVMSDSTSMFVMEVLELLRWAGDNTTLSLYYPVVKKAAQWMMSTAGEYGVPVKLETTYDILGFPRYTFSAYSSVYHIAALRAAAVLAAAAGDQEFTAACTERANTARDAIDQYQYNTTGNYYFAGSSDCTTGSGCKQQVGVFADSFYGQVLAFSAGLGVLTSTPDKIAGHLAAQLQRNCFHLVGGAVVQGCPNGLITITGRPPEVTDWQLWEMASPDHATLAIRLGLPVDPNLAVFEGAATSWSKRQNDQWNTAGIKDSDGQPTVTSHYGYHMPSWHVPLALSGQLADLSNPSSSWLTFAPRVKAPYDLPVMLPGVLGTISQSVSGQYTLAISIGTLTVSRVAVNNVAYHGAVNLSPGRSITWS